MLLHASTGARAAFAAAVVLAGIGAAAARASDHAAAAPASEAHSDKSGHAPAHGSGHGAPAEHDVQRTDILDLGDFKIRNTLTEHNTTVDIRMALHLILSSTTTPADHERLRNWQRRLRDQAIIAVRSADPADFADPELKRVRRLILLRVCRLQTPAKIIGIYLTDFAVDKVE